MLENEEPWIPPTPQSTSTVPRLLSQVPELTIINTDRFTETTTRPKTAIPIQNIKYNSNPSTAGFSTTPSVPDISILDHSNKSKPSTSSNIQNRALTQSYKDMLINAQEEIKQNRLQTMTEASENVQPMRQGLLAKSQASYDYRPNPLCKYMPSKITAQQSSPHVANTSSILIDTSNSEIYDGNSSGNDDLQLKNVAGILSEIQKLMTPTKGNSPDKKKTQPSNDILRKLAKTYLTEDEYNSFAVEEELR